jgi:hypothetical protein
MTSTIDTSRRRTRRGGRPGLGPSGTPTKTVTWLAHTASLTLAAVLVKSMDVVYDVVV